jgi:hypothetical protein
LALLWLRLAVALIFARDAVESLARSQQLPCILVSAAALLIGTGFLTPAFALCTAVVEITWMMVHRADEWWSTFLVASILIALTVLGPGAYSIDRWLFGRKRLTIGRSPH